MAHKIIMSAHKSPLLSSYKQAPHPLFQMYSKLKWANLQSKQAKKKEDKLAEESLQGFETD